MPRRPRTTTASLTAPPPPLPLDPLVPHLAALLREVIASQSSDWDARAILFWALQTLTRVCREARALAQIDGLRWLCLFEWHAQAHGRGSPRRAPRLCDGLPLWFHLPDECRRVTGPVHTDVYAKLGISARENVQRRYWFARRCAQPSGTFVFPARFIKPDDSQHVIAREALLDGLIGSPEHRFAPDLDDLVPAPVARFVAFLRWWLACTLVADDATSDCATCSAPGCLRPAIVRDPTPEEADALCEPSYWPRLRSGVATLGAEAAWPINMPWCSCACEDAGTDEFFRRVHPCSATELAAPPSATRAVRRTTRVSAARLLNASLERNAVVARRLRHERRDAHAPLRYYPLSAEGLRAYHARLAFALNVDVGILYAAMLLESWPLARRPARPLPHVAEWRDGVAYIGAICAVQRACRDAAEPATLTTSLVSPPRWMGTLRDTLDSIF